MNSLTHRAVNQSVAVTASPIGAVPRFTLSGPPGQRRAVALPCGSFQPLAVSKIRAYFLKKSDVIPSSISRLDTEFSTMEKIFRDAGEAPTRAPNHEQRQKSRQRFTSLEHRRENSQLLCPPLLVLLKAVPPFYGTFWISDKVDGKMGVYRFPVTLVVTLFKKYCNYCSNFALSTSLSYLFLFIRLRGERGSREGDGETGELHV